MPTPPPPAARAAAPAPRPTGGRPEVTSVGDIERAAFSLFGARGFDGTTLDDIAQAVGVSRRTLFRYYPSKNDIPWGQFDETLAGFRSLLHAMPDDLPLPEQVRRAVIAFNDFPAEAQPGHLLRMRLILETPALQAHSWLRYAAWRAEIAAHVAARSGLTADAVLPRTVGHVALGLSLTAYEQWLLEPDVPVTELLGAAFSSLEQWFAG